MAAHAQGRFWKFADAIEAKVRARTWVPEVTRAQIDEIARGIGLDMKLYEQAMADHRHRARIDEDLSFAKTIGVNATPTFFINGRHLSGAQPIEKFRDVFAQEVVRAEKLRAQGFRGSALRDALVSDAQTLPKL